MVDLLRFPDLGSSLVGFLKTFSFLGRCPLLLGEILDLRVFNIPGFSLSPVLLIT